MADFILTPEPPLAGYDRDFGHLRLRAPADLSLVAVALPLGGEKAAKAAITSAWGVDIPAPGTSAESKDGTRLIWSAPDQLFALFERATPDAGQFVARRLSDAVYVTDVTDGWVAIEVSGHGSRAALERICPVDLHPDAFGEGDAQRTVMEHLGVLILRTGKDCFLLLSASSSADSFRHALEVSAKNTA